MPIHLYRQNPDSLERELLGEITDEQLDFLVENLEEEFEEDLEYFINQETVEYLRGRGADVDLLRMLENAVADDPEGIEIAYQYE